MFERFTESARTAVSRATAEARGRRATRVEVEHLVMGLLLTPSLAATVLGDLGFTAKDIRFKWFFGQLVDAVPPLSEAARQVLEERALREALSLGHNYIATEHILLGLAQESFQLFPGLDVRKAVLDALCGPQKPSEPEPKAEPTPDLTQELRRLWLQTARESIQLVLDVLSE